MNKEQFLNIKKGHTIELSYNSAMKKDNKVILRASQRPRSLKGGKVHKLTLQNVNNLKGCKYYVYLRGDYIGFAFGDMGIVTTSIKIN